ncbi:MAG: glycosyltransferase family 4 protein [Ketobacteraceae bacterium]|nr:glycosyltransferase family 4 protein [Ketobacteraceae bacterium]
MAHVAFVVERRYRQPALENTTDLTEQLYVPTFMHLIALALIKRGHQVDIYTNVASAIERDAIHYRPISHNRADNRADLVVVHNGARDLRHFIFRRAAVWQHNATTLSKSWKRGELWELLRYRPDLICLSEDARVKTPRWLPYRKKHVIPHGINHAFLEAAEATPDRKKKRAFFASRPSRNLDFLIRAWETHVHPAIPEAELVICGPPTNKPFPFDQQRLSQSGIQFVGSLNLGELIELGKTSRMLCYPGHEAETGCRVALDAIGMGLPIITCGIGSLKDLVYHDKSGYIETDEAAYARRIIQCMNDDTLWARLSENACQHPWRQSYDENVLLWESAFELK